MRDSWVASQALRRNSRGWVESGRVVVDEDWGEDVSWFGLMGRKVIGDLKVEGQGEDELTETTGPTPARSVS